MIKIILIIIFIAIFAIVSLPLYFMVFIIGKFNPRKKVEVSQKIVVAVFKFILFFSGIKIIKDGVENIPKDEAVLYTSNHRSYFDILTGYTTVPTLTGFVAKKSMQKIPCIANWMKRLNCLFIDRDDIRQGMQVILKGIDNIKNGYSMFIMPEGTRNHEKEMLEFHDASFKMAQKTGCAVIPVAIIGSDDHFENCFPRVKGGKIYIRYGKPIYLTQLPKEEQRHPGAKVRGIIADMIDDMEKTMIK